MPEPETLDPPVLRIAFAPPMARVPDPKWWKEREAFFRMLPELLKTHGENYVAVHDERVVGFGADPIDVVKRAYAQYGYVPIYVGLVTDHPPPPVRVPSPRAVQSHSA